MKKNLPKLIALLFLFLTSAASAAEVTVFAAASLTDVLKELARNYEKETGDKIVFNFAASSLLARQIAASAPADVFFSADEAKMNELEAKGLIDKSTRISRLSNALVVVVSGDSTLQLKSGQDLTNTLIKRIALAEPKSVPAGIYAKEWLEGRGLWEAVQPRVVPTENVRGALAAVESGNVECGVVYKTDAAISKKVKMAFEVPAEEAPRVSYPMAVTKESKQPEAAKKFLNYLDSKAAGDIFKKFGFGLRD